ncbi:MAG: SAM-dependent methyltransferase [Clostridiales bacterium]|nr:SAM-dependent methyltransferase [Clostridiales bacterium]
MNSVRLATLVSLIPSCNLLADVGCDHGYVGIEALRLGIAKQVAFADISQPSLLKARSNCPKEFNDVVSFHCQDGLGSLKVDCAIIAGMGGLEVISILKCAKYLPDRLVLQPMRNQRDVRAYLTANNYDIVTDVKFCDGKYYDAIVAERCVKPTRLTELELEFGKTNLVHPSKDFINYLQLELNKLNKILEGTRDSEVVSKRNLVEQTLKLVLTQNI